MTLAFDFIMRIQRELLGYESWAYSPINITCQKQLLVSKVRVTLCLLSSHLTT